jgi:hypothetical protein
MALLIAHLFIYVAYSSLLLLGGGGCELECTMLSSINITEADNSMMSEGFSLCDVIKKF